MPDRPPTPDDTTCVFICYAREDEVAAKNLHAGLRAAGIDAWLDQTGLRGGDAWDRKIERLIRTCLLFAPIISKSTVARDEGYFRMEWRRAVKRMATLADDIPFLLPVTIDETIPNELARVPEEFLGIQWTRLRDGVVTQPFVDRIRDSIAARRPREKRRSVSVSPSQQAPQGLLHFSCRLTISRNKPAIFGFVIPGTQRQRILIRGVGPSLAKFGLQDAIPDPVLSLFSGSRAVSISKKTGLNPEKQDHQLAEQIRRAVDEVGAFQIPPRTKDAAILESLPPGAYSVQLASASGSTGTALLEIYQIRE